MTTHEINRRTVLRAAGGAAVAAAASPLLAACGSDDDIGGSTGPTGGSGSDGQSSGGGQPSSPGSSSGPSSSGGSGLDALLPTYTPKEAVKPDLPGDDNGTPDGFLAYPAKPVKVFDKPPLNGGTITSLKIVGTALPPPVNKNPFWQELNKRVGATLKMNNIIAADYKKKLATVVAGGDLPDIMQMSVGYVPHAQDFLKTTCEDLSPWLAGDAAKKYPYLAALPTISWKNVIFGGGIYGIPYPLGIVGSDIKVRQDLADKVGVSTDMKNGDDFMALCKGLSVEDKRWAIDSVAHAMRLVEAMVGAPNGYRIEDGKFVNAVQTDEYKQALGICNELWAKGYIYPPSLTSMSGFHSWFFAGKTAISRDGYTNWSNLTAQGLKANPDFKMDGLVLPKWDGSGQAAHPTGSGMYTFTAVKKAKDSRIEDLLEMFNWFTTPFGTEEYLFKKYGLKGRDYTLDGTDPVWTDTGVNEVQHMNTPYIATAPQPLYMPGHPDVCKTQHAYLKELMKVTAPLPTVGLVSETSLAKAASLNQAITDGVNDVVTGRKKVSDWDGIVKTYLSKGGDAINKEYSEAYAKVHG